MAGLGIRIEPDSRSLRLLREAISGFARFGRGPRRSLGRLGLFIRRFAQRLLRARARDWGNAGGGKLGKSLAILLDSMSVTVGSNLVYAAIQQLGGTISPKAGRKYLALPALPELRRSGTYPRDLPRESMKFVPNARIRIGTHAWIGPALVRAEDVVNAQGRKTKRAGQVMFALVKRVTIKGREYLVFGPEARSYLIGELKREAAEIWTAASRAARGGGG
jgi:phage gpG-like protein